MSCFNLDLKESFNKRLSFYRLTTLARSARPLSTTCATGSTTNSTSGRSTLSRRASSSQFISLNFKLFLDKFLSYK